MRDPQYMSDVLDLVEAGKEADKIVKTTYAWLMRYKAREFNDHEAGDPAIYSAMKRYLQTYGDTYATDQVEG